MSIWDLFKSNKKSQDRTDSSSGTFAGTNTEDESGASDHSFDVSGGGDSSGGGDGGGGN